MKQQVTLPAEKRDEAGKGAARRLRREGYIPAVVYGHGIDSENLKVRLEDLESTLHEARVGSTLVDLKVDGDSAPVLIREVQRHPFKAELLHVDFFKIRADETVRVSVPLRLEGKPIGVEEGGILQQNRHEVEVECLPGDIPEYFELDVSGLDIGDSFHIADLDTGGVDVEEEPDMTVCTVVPPTVITVEEEEEEIAALEELEPELVGRAPEEEEGAPPAEEEVEEPSEEETS